MRTASAASPTLDRTPPITAPRADLGAGRIGSGRGRGVRDRRICDQRHSSRSTPVKSTVETLSPTRVRLAIEVPFAELEPSLRKAYREIGSQVRVPGFRQGKVPAAVIDQRIGRGTVLNEAVQDAIPENIVAAVREHDVK